MALDAESKALVDVARAKATKPRHLMTPDEAREVIRNLGAILDKGPDMAAVRNYAVPVEGGEIEVRLLVPRDELSGLIVYIHGGGWVVGSNDEFEPTCRELASRTAFAIAMVCYRKAPEHPFPIPFEDAWSGFEWAWANRKKLVGREDLPLVIAGDSAGGNLAAAIALREKARGGNRIAAQLLVYPVVDADFDRASYVDPENQAMLTRETMISYWNHYVPEPAQRLEPEASPLRARNHSGLPPAIILTAEHDVLRDEGEEYAARLAAAGVDVRHRRFEGQIHAFMLMYGVLPGCIAGLEYAAAELRKIIP